MRKQLVRCLLATLNSRWLNQTPCKYEFVGNVDAFSRSNIESSLRGDPGMSLRAYLDAADRFKTFSTGEIARFRDEWLRRTFWRRLLFLFSGSNQGGLI